jgi:integrase
MNDGHATQPRRVRIERGIYRRPDGKLEIGWRDSTGRQCWRKVEGGIKAARARLAEEHARRARGERAAVDPRLRFADAANAWWDSHVLNRRPSTQSAYAANLKHLRAHFDRRRMTDITAADVAAYLRTKQTDGLMGWTLKGHLSNLSAIFSFAARHLGLVGTNPVSLLERSERPSTDDEKPKRILSPDELERLLHAVDDQHRPIFALAAETGGRLGEVLGLTWENVDFTAQTITFTHQLDRRKQRSPLKTRRSRRTLEVTPGLITTLRALKLATPYSGPHDLVFTTKIGTAHDHRNIAGRVLRRAVERAGLEAVERHGVVIQPAPVFHALRHSHASRLIAAGWDIEEVSARLGHANIATTQQTYIHEFDAAKRSDERRNRLAQLYGTELRRGDLHPRR